MDGFQSTSITETTGRLADGLQVIPPDAILITDVGVGRLSDAFYWFMLGHHVYDCKNRGLTVRDLEQSVDPENVMEPIYVRGHLWKTVPQRFWLAVGGGKNGPEAVQPGLNAQTSGDYYYCHELEPRHQYVHPLTISRSVTLNRATCHMLPESSAPRAILKKSKSTTSLDSGLPGSLYLSHRASFSSAETLISSLKVSVPIDETRITQHPAYLTWSFQRRDHAKSTSPGSRARRRASVRWDSLFDCDSESCDGEGLFEDPGLPDD